MLGWFEFLCLCASLAAQCPSHFARLTGHHAVLYAPCFRHLARQGGYRNSERVHLLHRPLPVLGPAVTCGSVMARPWDLKLDYIGQRCTGLFGTPVPSRQQAQYTKQACEAKRATHMPRFRTTQRQHARNFPRELKPTMHATAHDHRPWVAPS